MTEQPKPFTVEAGKRYVAEDGDVYGPMMFNERYSQGQSGREPWMFTDEDGKFWSEDGRIGCRTPNDYASISLRLSLISEYKEPTAEPQDEWGPWIGWNGGECPVECNPNVQVILMDADPLLGREPFQLEGGAEELVWNYGEKDEDIVAYRVKKEPVVRERDCYLGSSGHISPTRAFADEGARKAIITTKGDDIDIDWVE